VFVWRLSFCVLLNVLLMLQRIIFRLWIVFVLVAMFLFRMVECIAMIFNVASLTTMICVCSAVCLFLSIYCNRTQKMGDDMHAVEDEIATKPSRARKTELADSLSRIHAVCVVIIMYLPLLWCSYLGFCFVEVFHSLSFTHMYPPTHMHTYVNTNIENRRHHSRSRCVCTSETCG